MMHGSVKRRAAAMAAIMLAASFCCALPVLDDDEAPESDGLVIELSAVGIFALGFVCGAVTGGLAGYALAKEMAKQKDAYEDALRQSESNSLYKIVTAVKATYSNSLQQYSRIWPLTGDHWIREAELSASVLWRSGAEYNPANIMAASGIYGSSSMMLANVVAQPNAIFDAITDYTRAWADDPAYDGRIVTSWTYGDQALGSASTWGGKDVWAATVPVSAGDGLEVYIGSGGHLMCFDSQGSAIGPDGAVALPSGDAKTISEGIYRLAAGATYVSDRMLPVIASDSADVHPGVIMSAGGSSKLAVYDPDTGKIAVDGVSYDDLGVTFKAEGSEAYTVDFTDTLKQRAVLLSAVGSTMNRADTSAWSVWQIYNRAGAASTYLTTLTVPDYYNKIEMSAVQKELLTVLALQQLAAYYDTHSGELLKEYKATPGSNELYIRGDITDETGMLIAKDAIFTPYYWSKDDSISLGSNTEAQAANVLIYATGYTGTLSSWDGSAIKPAVITSKAGYVFDVAEIMHAKESVTSVDLDVMQIDYIDPERIVIDPTPSPDPDDSKDWTTLIIIAAVALAVMLAFSGLTRGRPELVVVAAILAVIGVAGADTINDWIVNGIGFGGIL